jgi:ssDNA-specific exonuclease RecJ
VNIKEMDVFMNTNYNDFREYAIQDSVLALFHTLKVEETVIIELKKMFIPVSLASFSGSFLQSKLDITKYKLPLNPVFQSSLQEVYTPIGVESNPFSLHLPLFLGSLHGGRNESYVYGLCLGEFYDYDLPGAYPTAMSLLGYPDYTKIEIFLNLSGEELLKSPRDLLKSYTVLKVKFQFPKTCVYPNLPVRLEKSSIIYPLTGEGICTGSEFLLAMDLNCSIEIEQGVYIPFLQEDGIKIKECENTQSIQRQPNHSLCYEELDYVQLQAVEDTQIDHVPSVDMLKQAYTKFGNFEITDFYKLVKSLIDERKKYPSKSYNNLLYKLIANSGIGQMSRGLSRKKSYNPLLKTTTIIPSGSLTNPLFASWITSFIRTVLSEILNYISTLDSEKIIISSTTDGFICNIIDLNKYDFGRFSSLYRYARERLGFENILLELKHTEPKGLLS